MRCSHGSVPATTSALRLRGRCGDILAAWRAATRRPTNGKRSTSELVATRPRTGRAHSKLSPAARSHLHRHCDAPRRRRHARKRSKRRRARGQPQMVRVTRRVPWMTNLRCRWCLGRNGFNCRGTPTVSTGCASRRRKKTPARSHPRRRTSAAPDPSAAGREAIARWRRPRPTWAGVSRPPGSRRRRRWPRRRCNRLAPTRRPRKRCTSWQSDLAAASRRHARVAPSRRS